MGNCRYPNDGWPSEHELSSTLNFLDRFPDLASFEEFETKINRFSQHSVGADYGVDYD